METMRHAGTHSEQAGEGVGNSSWLLTLLACLVIQRDRPCNIDEHRRCPLTVELRIDEATAFKIPLRLEWGPHRDESRVLSTTPADRKVIEIQFQLSAIDVMHP